MSEPGPWSRSVRCLDWSGRDRHLVVFLTEAGDLALIAPPGEVAIIPPGRIAEVQEAFNEAHVKAIARRISP
jgi:hypothetical protein